ncbi:MAG: phage major capsid protein [Candidatus Cloacimonetes bacterium]|nr:phage major capsid protein [Candidatus Cloacimonadota bacterium]
MEEVKVKELIQSSWKELQDALEVKFAEVKKFGEANAEIEEKINKLNEKIDNLEAKLNRPPIETNQVEQENSKQAFLKYMRKGILTPEELKFLATDEGATGGFLVPPTVDAGIIEKLRAVSAIRSIANVKTISGNVLEVLRQKDKFTVKVKGERELASNPSTAANKLFELLRIPTHSYQPDPPIAITRELLEDANTNMETWLTENLVADYAEKEGTDFVIGSGSNSATGILTSSITEVKSGDANSIKPDSLIKLVYDLPSKFAKNAKFLMHRKTIGEIRQLKDPVTGTYFWQPSLLAGEPQQILNIPVVEDDNMPVVAANAYPIVLGDWSWYYVVDRRGIIIERDTTKYFPFIVFYSTKRTGGMCVREEAFRKYKIST